MDELEFIMRTGQAARIWREADPLYKRSLLMYYKRITDSCMRRIFNLRPWYEWSVFTAQEWLANKRAFASIEELNK